MGDLGLCAKAPVSVQLMIPLPDEVSALAKGPQKQLAPESLVEPGQSMASEQAGQVCSVRFCSP